MYKMITQCTNCGTEFESDREYEECEVELKFVASDTMGIRSYGRHNCVGGEVGMKVFKCFREVKE